MARRKQHRSQRGAVITDGCNPELVDGARFDGVLEIPVIERPEKIAIPKGFVPFSEMHRVLPEKFAVCEYEADVDFADLLRDPAPYTRELRRFQAFVTPDASLFWDAPLAAQIVNKYRNHAVGSYMQRHGVYTIPNVRWGDERTYTTCALPEPLAFLGVEKGSIVSIGSYGLVRTKLEKHHFRAGLGAMLDYLEPEVVLVYGPMPEEVFGEFSDRTEFVRYPDWTTYIHEGGGGLLAEDSPLEGSSDTLDKA
jgi:hypothetical protein